jgi:hypothetical protein
MTTGATGQLGLALPVQGELSGTWGDTVNNGITQYTNIAIAGTLTLTGDGAVTLANTTGDASASNITSTLAGAGTVTAQFAIVKVSGTTTTKVVTGPSYSKTYVVDNSSSYAVTFKASGQTGVSIAAGEKVTVFFNSAVSNADYIKLAGTIANAAGSNTQVQYNSSGVLAGSANMTFDGTTLTAAGFSGPHNGTVGATTATTGAFTTLAASSTVTLSGGTANGVTYLNGSKVLTSGSALVFDGTKLGIGTSSPPYKLSVSDGGATGFEVGPGTTYVAGRVLLQSYNRSGSAYTAFDYSASEHKFQVSGSDAMVLTSTGLGIGTSSIGRKLEVSATTGLVGVTSTTGTNYVAYQALNTGGTMTLGLEGSSPVIFSGATAYSAIFGTGGAYSLHLATNNTVRQTIDSSGNVGIGTTPGTILDVAQDVATAVRNTSYNSTNAATTSSFQARRARGTAASYSAVLSGDSV